MAGDGEASKLVADVMTRDVAQVAASKTIIDVAELMTARGIGSVVVMDGGRVAGILTERDILTRVLNGRLNPAVTQVGEVMTTPAVTVGSGVSIYYASKLMERNFCRRLPVVDSGRLMGIVTQTDLSRAMTATMIDLIPQVETQLNPAPAQWALEPGKSYLLEERKPMKSFEIFVDAVKHGRAGLCLSRESPASVKRTYGLTATPVVWVTEAKTEEPAVDPRDLEGLVGMVIDFAAKAADGIVFLEAFTYLTEFSEFGTVLRHIQRMRDAVSQGGCSLLVYVDPILLTEKETEQLSEEMDEIRFRVY
jgi:CBS domain-containing protein